MVRSVFSLLLLVVVVHAQEPIPEAFNPSVFVTYNGNDYAVLDGTPANTPFVFDSSRALSCQDSYLPLPAGWSFVDNTPDVIAVIGAYPWGTHVVMTNQGAYRVSTFDGPGLYSANNPNYVNPDGTVKPSFCSVRIMVKRASAEPGCTSAERDACDEYAVCTKEPGDPAACTCPEGFIDTNGDGTSCADINECLIEGDGGVGNCDHLAYCDNTAGSFQCTCPEGFLGDGLSCSNTAWGVRSVCNFVDVDVLDLDLLRLQYSQLVTGDLTDLSFNLTYQSPIVETASIKVLSTQNQVTINALFATEAEASSALANIVDPDWSILQGCSIVDGPDVYSWVGQSTSDPLKVKPSGFEIDSISFDIDCLNSGCWVVDVTYTTGTDDFNAFYLPEADGNDAFSYDFDYSTPDITWTTQSPADTFFPNTHPCTSADYDAADGVLAQVSSCCLDQFLAMYRPIASFVTDVAGKTGSNCGVGARDRALAAADVYTFTNGELEGDDSAPKGVYVDGVFSGLSYSKGMPMGVIDPYVGIYKARFLLDEVELRRSAGQLKGTVGVEHTVDTFLGLINLSPTGMFVLDTFATQTAIHLEKTSFFSVSTHGTNDYTFLEYVNLRLVAIYLEDTDFSGASESTDRTVRTDPSDAAHYVQVTFTLGQKYEVNTNSGLIPSASVRAGTGTFFQDATLDHKCLEWEGASGYSFDKQTTFNSRLGQACAPAAAMCSSPTSIPDSFVSFNIPLGIDELPPATTGLSNNVFVDMVISAVDTVAQGSGGSPNEGDAPWQMKTTLTASIPVVAGGVNIFCDGFTSKTDLRDVADADIVVGSASSLDELTRLRIKANVTSTQLNSQGPTEINSDSIEAGLMTLVIKGSDSYFDPATNPGLSDVSVELEDVITIHIMDENGDSSSGATVFDDVMTLITGTGPDDNSDTNGLITDGYTLNGAFKFTIDRSAQRAHLEPLSALLALCPFNPTRPNGNMLMETCVTRRDVRYRNYPWRNGAKSTAMEICTAGAGTCATTTNSDEADFFATILGDSTYARELGVAYAGVISSAYTLNGRYRRAYWINPGYEWTPTQTNGASLFSISQKLILFALITLDEGIAGDPGNSIAGDPGPNLRRRMLLQSTSTSDALKDGQSGLGADAFTFATTPTTMMAKAFSVPEDRVATLAVQLQLTADEACQDTPALQNTIRLTLDDLVQGFISEYHTLQVTSLSVHPGSVQCGRRSRRGRALLSFSDATADVKMLVVFAKGTAAQINIAKIAEAPGVNSITPLSVSANIDTEVKRPIVTPAPASGTASSSSSNTVLVAGVAGGVGGAIVLLIGALLFMRSKKGSVPVAAVQTLNVNDLKSQLAEV